MRVAVYGGSFNPPHVGHAMVACWLRWTERVDQVWLLPAFAHPFDKELVPFRMRVGFCEALVDSLGPWARVEPIEEELPRPSYTIDTLGALAARHPSHRFRLVVGADALPTLSQWKRWDLIERQFPPIVVGRQGYPEVSDAPVFPDVSSTEIRRRLRGGEAVDHLVPAAVLRRLGGVYGPSAGGPKPMTP